MLVDAPPAAATACRAASLRTSAIRPSGVAPAQHLTAAAAARSSGRCRYQRGRAVTESSHVDGWQRVLAPTR